MEISFSCLILLILMGIGLLLKGARMCAIIMEQDLVVDKKNLIELMIPSPFVQFMGNINRKKSPQRQVMLCI